MGKAPAALPCGQLHSEYDLCAAHRAPRSAGAGPRQRTECAEERHGRASVSGTRMTASGALAATAAGAAPPPSAWPRPWAGRAVIIAATLLAVGLGLYHLSRPGYLPAIGEYADR